MTQDPTTTAPARRVFIYGDHRFDDPGSATVVIRGRPSRGAPAVSIERAVEVR